jgi:hypothetical protein
MARLFYFGKLLTFVALSLADLYLTWRLLETSDGIVYESNPIANRLLRAYGWTGVVVFKASLVFLVASVVAVLERYRPRAAARLLTVSCTIVGAVVLYSASLQQWVDCSGRWHLLDLGAAELRNDAIDNELRLGHAYSRTLAESSKDLAEGRCTLLEAVVRLSATEKAQSDAWIRILRGKYPNRSRQECLAVNLIEHSLGTRRGEPKRMLELHEKLNSDFRSTFRSEPPMRYMALRGVIPANSDLASTETKSVESLLAALGRRCAATAYRARVDSLASQLLLALLWVPCQESTEDAPCLLGAVCSICLAD